MKKYIPTADDYKLEQERAEAGRSYGVERSVKQRKRQDFSTRQSAQSIISDAVPLIAEEIQATIDNHKPKNPTNWYPFIYELDTEMLANIAIRQCVKAVGSRHSRPAVGKLIGRMVEANVMGEVIRQAFKDFHPRGKKEYKSIYNRAVKRSDDFERRLHYVKNQVAKEEITMDFLDWTEKQCMEVGFHLIKCVTQSTEVVEVYDYWDTNKIKDMSHRFRYTAEIQNRIDEADLEFDLSSPAFRPMVVPPINWGTANHVGPYYDTETAIRAPLVKNVNPNQRKKIVKALKTGSMKECLDAVNTLQQVPYTINRYTLAAIKWVVESKLDVEIEEFVPVTPPIIDENDKDGTPSQVKRYYRAQRKKSIANANLVQFQTDLNEAESLCDKDDRRFWLPHNFDFRGRVYHIPAFGHHRQDHIRGLFMFADKKPITKDNLKHLYFQIATTWGNQVSETDERKTDKITLDERYKWVEDNYEAILLAGKDYVAGFEHWSKADAPIQHLAACRELYLADQHGEGYLCGLPIGFDGSNSGLQHYSMLMKWKEDAFKVNLVPNHPPQDCYSFIAEADMNLAQRIVDGECDELNENEITNAIMDDCHNWLKHGITRKQTKKNIMTWPYSVTLIGMADQNRDDMEIITDKAEEEDAPHPFGEDRGSSASMTLAKLNSDSIKAVVASGARGMEFLRDLAGILASRNVHAEWTSILGFPVGQDYRDMKKVTINTEYIDRKTTRKVRYRGTLRAKQPTCETKGSKNGIAPNFVHHMDSTHLMMSVNKSNEYGASNLMCVHDSFSTDIESASVMLDCIKVTLIELYEEVCHYSNLLEDCKSLVEYSDNPDDPDYIEWPEVPEKGEGDNALDVRAILDCDYAFA
ncbi:DNA-directed RNA polymerase [Candidatus Puniceispirillum marinum]|uniref:DNA-directed RNA polymerase n=1 Tax=Candidatus Puniceispirillum marinum TaxID=767892 RepID=UPI00167FA89C|nr:DNA-directed RNA polymerase [Candidatus Puniceispirillum marinum]